MLGPYPWVHVQEGLWGQTSLTGLQSSSILTYGIPTNGLRPLIPLTASVGPGNCTGCGNYLQDKTQLSTAHEEGPACPTTAPGTAGTNAGCDGDIPLFLSLPPRK